MEEKRDILGLWWLPTNPTDRWVGTLTLEKGKSASFALIDLE
jgi:hypothetical protein